MMKNRLVQRHHAEIHRLAEKHGVRNIRVFGSVARGDAEAKSDVDLLVELEPGRNLLDLGGLQMDLDGLSKGGSREADHD